jgi:hypothetical protein
MNKLKGEIEVTIDEKKYILRPTFEAMLAIEDKAKCGISLLSYKFSSYNVGVNDLTAIVWGGIVGGLSSNETIPFTFEELGEFVVLTGVQELLRPCADFISFGITGEKQADKKGESKLKKKIIF